MTIQLLPFVGGGTEGPTSSILAEPLQEISTLRDSQRHRQDLGRHAHIDVQVGPLHIYWFGNLKLLAFQAWHLTLRSHLCISDHLLDLRFEKHHSLALTKAKLPDVVSLAVDFFGVVSPALYTFQSKTSVLQSRPPWLRCYFLTSGRPPR